MFRTQNQKSRIYAWAGLVLLLGPFGTSKFLATPLLAGVNGPKDTRSLPNSCRALGNSSSELFELIAKAAARPSSYDAVAQAFAERNELACAIAAYEVALDFQPTMWQTRYALGVTLLQAGRSAQAVRELRAVLQRVPDSFLAHNALGLALENLTDLEGACEEYEKAVTLNTGFALGYYNLAHVASEEKRFSAAVFYSQRAVDLDPEQPSYQLALGIAYSEDGKFQQSADVLRKLAAARPEFIEVYLNLGAVYSQQNRFAESVKSYRQAINLDPENSRILLSLGIALVADSQQNEALSVFKHYVGREPRDFRGYYWLGRVYKDLAQYRDASSALGKALQLEGSDYEVRYNLGVVLTHLKRYAEAAQQLQVAEKLNPSGADVHYQLAGVLRALNDQKGTSQELKAFQDLKLRDKEKMQSIQYYNRGGELLAAGNFQQAAEQFRRALQLDPSSARLHYNLSLALRGSGDHEGQRRELERAIQLDSNLAPAFYHLAQLYIADGSVAQAKQALKTALAIEPQFAAAQHVLSSLEENGKRVE